MANKEYKDLTPKEKYDSAVKQDADKSQPGTMEMLGNLGRKAKDFAVDAITESPMYKMGKSAVDIMSLPPEKKKAEPVKKKAGGMCGGGKTMKKMAKGGSASSRADGCAVKGKTRGKMM